MTSIPLQSVEQVAAGRPFGAALLRLGPSMESRGDGQKEHAASHRLEG